MSYQHNITIHHLCADDPVAAVVADLDREDLRTLRDHFRGYMRERTPRVRFGWWVRDNISTALHMQEDFVRAEWRSEV